MLAGATGAATGAAAPLVWLVSLVLWHLSHNLINDAQDLRRGLDARKNAFRLQYGTHPLAVMPDTTLAPCGMPCNVPCHAGWCTM